MSTSKKGIAMADLSEREEAVARGALIELLRQLIEVDGLSMDGVIACIHAELIGSVVSIYGPDIAAKLMHRTAEMVERMEHLNAHPLAAAKCAGRA